MKPFKAISNFLTGKKETNYFPSIHSSDLGWHSLGSATHALETNNYDSAYPSIRVISDQFMTIAPYAIDKNGKKVDARVIDKLYHPNQQFSSARFRKALAIMALVHPKVYLLVWHEEGGEVVPGGDITKDNIAGFTFLEGVVETVIDKKIVYNYGTHRFTDKEVLVLSGINPYDLSGGYSPSIASRKWSTVADYVADYQKGFFENGAVPQGMFTIVAPSAKEFNDIVKNMQDKHRGAGKNNNVSYSHTPIDPTTGKPATVSSITWTPFATTNREIDIKSLLDQAEKRIDSNFGVPASIRGVNESNTYASVRVDQAILAEYVVDPFTLLCYADIQHGLDRITRGLGIAITYDYEIPQVADEDKVIAETKQIELTMIIEATQAGYTLDSIVDSLKLPLNYKLLKTTGKPPVIENDKPDVDEGGEVETAPNANDVTKEVAKSDTLKAVSEQERLTYEQKLSEVVRQHMRKQIDKAINATKAVATEVEVEEFTDDMMVLIVEGMVASGVIQYREGVNLLLSAGIVSGQVSAFKLSQVTISDYRAYLENVAKSYTDDTAVSIRSVLATANEQGWNRAQMHNALRGIMSTDEYRVIRLAGTEVNRSQNLASIDSMRQIAGETGVQFEKGFIHTAGDTPCEFCQTILSTWIPLDKMLLPKGDILIGSDGGIMINDFADNDGWDVHPNGHCVPTYRVAS